MKNFFYGAEEFNQPLPWDVSAVTCTRRMFRGAQKFNQDISDWDVVSLDDFEEMFTHAKAFNRDLCEWGDKIPDLEMILCPPKLNVFVDTSCPIKLDPADEEGPWCHAC